MFTKNLDTNTRDHITEGSNKKEITVNMNDTINVVIRRRISNREESSESLRYKTSFSPIQNNMFINTKMQVDSVGDDNTQGSKTWSTTKTEKRNEDQPLSPPYLSDIVNMKYDHDNEINKYFRSSKVHDNGMSTFSSVDEKNIQFFRKKAAEGENLESNHLTSFLITIIISAFFITLTLYQSTFFEGIQRWPHHDQDHVDIPDRVEMFRDYAEDVVPDLENFYVSSEMRLSMMGSTVANVSQENNQECVQYWNEKYHDVAGEMFNVSQTNPQDVRKIVDFLGLSGVERVESTLSTHLSTNVSTESFFQSIQQCASQNHLLYVWCFKHAKV